MNKLRVSLLVLILGLGSTGTASAERKPLHRPILAKIEHEPTRNQPRYNPKTRQFEEVNPEGRIAYEEKSGNFLLQWIGLDGKKKTIVYEPATKLDAAVAAAVEYDAKTRLYRYSHALWNLPSSRGKLQTFYLETQALIEAVKPPAATWYSRAFTDYLRQTFKVKGGWAWSQTRGRLGLLPGESASGFSFQSLGLPAVVKCYVDRPPGLKGVGEEWPEELGEAIDRVAWKIPEGVTVGPATPPERVDPVAFLRRLIEMVNVSLQQGWIESPIVAGELRKLLEEAVAAIERGDTGGASATLRTLLRRVEQENQRTLLSEAYALLRFNTEFLLKHLRN